VTVHVSGGPQDGTPVILQWFRDASEWDGPSPLVIEQLGLRTRDGQAVGHVPSDRQIVAVVGAGADLTEEWTPAVAAGRDAADLDVHLYSRAGWHARLTGLIGPVQAGVPGPPVEEILFWERSDLELGSSAAESHAVKARIETLDAVLLWDNTLTASADLGLAVAKGNASNGCDADDGMQLAAGHFTEALHAKNLLGCWGGGYDHDCTMRMPDFRIGPYTRRQVVAPLGLPYAVDINATLVASYGWQDFADHVGDREVKRTWVPTSDEAPAPAEITITESASASAKASGARNAVPHLTPVPNVSAMVACLLAAVVIARRERRSA